jgi:signal transduction histidine kinase
MISAPGPPEDGHEVRVGVVFDITAQKQAEALRSERDRAAAADLAKSHFMSRVSHELRTPLNAILGFAQLLDLELDASKPAGARQRDWLRQVLGSGRHLLALMNDILDLSSAQTGQLPIHLESLAVEGVVAEVVAMLAGTASEARVSLVGVPPMAGATLPPVRADRKRLKQILSNLLSNSIKYNQRGGWVRVEARAAEGRVELVVADSGPGMDEAQQARLFQPFERLGAQRGAVPGTGLGLALSRQLAEAMGGSIGVESQPAKGTRFTVRLPTAEAST